MKSLTHHVFSVGLMLFVLSRFGPTAVVFAPAAVVGAVLTNIVIDEVGHSRREGALRRSWATHSVLTAPLWGGVVWVLVLLVPALPAGVALPSVLLVHFALLGAVSGSSHLLLDSLTEGGVFGVGFQRRAVAHFQYDNPLLNFGFCALGVLLAAAAVLY